VRAGADWGDVQINFGGSLNEALGDAVKITVIATGFQPENAPMPSRRQIVVETHPQVIEAAPAPPPMVEEPEPEYVEPEPEPLPVVSHPPTRPLPPPQPNGF